MKYKMWIVPVILLGILAGSCKKSDEKTCWILVDQLGVFMNEVCGKSENDMNAQYGGQYLFFRSSDPRYCWKLTRPSTPDTYVRNVPQYIIGKFFAAYTAEIVNCSSFCKWKVLYKDRSKITGDYAPVTQKTEAILNINDTCGKLFVGRVVTVSETADSIHTAAFAEYIDQY